ncbi:hypothetical protein FOCC_FOCC002121 [Frankliniella occidentalis]|nr:hypothetical protein FOCC_FOCC002121 [Frankliniella occidentalis]
MFKSLLLVFAILAVASAQYLASPYYAGYSNYGGLYRSAAAYPAYSAYSSYGAYPYAYSGLGYGSSYLYRCLFDLSSSGVTKTRLPVGRM